jgi:ubiquinol-cytochrome c reductase subunit 7
MANASLAPFIIKRPWLLKLLAPLSNAYMNTAGHRQMGLR